MAQHKNVCLSVDGCAYRGTKGTTNIIHTSLSMEDGSCLESAMRWDHLVAKPKAVRLRECWEKPGRATALCEGQCIATSRHLVTHNPSQSQPGANIRKVAF